MRGLTPFSKTREKTSVWLVGKGAHTLYSSSMFMKHDEFLAENVHKGARVMFNVMTMKQKD